MSKKNATNDQRNKDLKSEESTDLKDQHPDQDHKSDRQGLSDQQNDKTMTDLEEVSKERDEFKLSYMRALADYQNLERRMKEERASVINTAKASVMTALLPALDNLDRAEVFISDPSLKMVKDEFLRVFKELGVEEIDLLNKPFDPYTAEVIEVVEGDNDDLVVEVVQKAYKLGDEVIRHGRVKVGKKSEHNNK